MSDLKPCPFCGGEAEIFTLCDDYGTYPVVVCKTDGCRCSEDYAWSSVRCNENDAIKLWNDRVMRKTWRPLFNGKSPDGKYWFYCPNCKRTVQDARNGDWDFCPRCGADMRGEDNG